MTTDDLRENWKTLWVEVEGGIRVCLGNRYMICWGYIEEYDGLLFDEGGEQGATAHVYRVGEGDVLLSVNPENPAETRPIGKLVCLE